MDKPDVSDLIRRISLRQLQVFESLARNRSFTKAAEELFLAQPTVSMQIKKLNDTVGAPLFEQIGKSVHLTDAGHALHNACREVFEVFARFDTQLADFQGLKQGHLKLAVVSTAKYFAPILLGHFCERYPGIDVSLKVTNRERLLERMAENADEFYIIGEPPPHVNAAFERFMPNPLVVVAWREHPLASKQQIPLERLAKERFIMREPGSGTRIAILERFKSKDLRPEIRMELGSNEAIKQAVIAKLGISIMSRHALGQEMNERELAVLNVKGFPIDWDLFIGYAANRKLSLLSKTFLEFLRKEGRKIVANAAA
ncbi:MAG: LysR family transcriptional regulator [Gammaproteobacteria bacterium]|nr:LysR family transcriptional regulator [Gammaproteobacteria bacterium]